MLSIALIKASPTAAARYYTQGDYYAKDGDEPSEWLGKGASLLGHEGSVDGEHFKNLLKGELPEGHTAGWYQAKEDHRPGWDLTFSAPKGVSIMAIVAGDKRLVEAHRQAVKEAIAFAETYAFVRERKADGSYDIRATDNLTVAQFTEFFSRALDPQLHTHSVVMNATWDKERQAWYAFHSEALFRIKMAAGQVYRNELAQHVKALGYRINAARDTGLFDIKGIPQALMDTYSKRREAIVAFAKENGWTAAADYARATLLTRPNKAKTRHDDVLGDLKERSGENLETLHDLKRHAVREARASDLDDLRKHLGAEKINLP